MQPFANVLQNRCFYKFLEIYNKISVLESLCNKATGLMAFNFIKKEAPSQVFSCEYHKCLTIAFYGTFVVAASENGRNICTKEFIKEKDL